MSQSFVNWVIDSLASEDVIDLYFILSDLKDIVFGPGEREQSAHYDAASMSGIGSNEKGTWTQKDPNGVWTNVDTGEQEYNGKMVF